MSTPRLKSMSFDDALKRLGIEDFKSAIWHSNSRGELFHLQDYKWMASKLDDKAAEEFRLLFIRIVEWAEKNWERPESCYQHMPRLLYEFTYPVDEATPVPAP
jgi:hypothetical protein